VAKKLTISDIAEKAGVAKSTVSFVLNDRGTKVPISAETRRKVMAVVERYGYQPNSSARALSTRRTGHIGFILSDNITDGLFNSAYAQVMAGAERGCRNRGYGLNVSLYNLSNIGSFVFPKRIGERSVDGLVLTGYVEAAVVQRFREFDIPCVCVGDNLEVAEMIPVVAGDFVDGLHQAAAAAAELGHRHILYYCEHTRRGQETAVQLTDRVAQDAALCDAGVRISTLAGQLDDYHDAGMLLNHWLAMPAATRPTAILGISQTLLGLIPLLAERGLSCPKDVSLISTSDSQLFEFSVPTMSAIHYDLVRFGEIAVDMLVDHLDDSKPLTADLSRWEPCSISRRASLGACPLK
jgi:LacI family transcriptional regulator